MKKFKEVCIMQERALIEERLAKMPDPLLRDLGQVLWEFIQMQFYPTPYALRQVAEVLLEVRELMFLEIQDPFGGFINHAILQILDWIESTKQGNSYELSKVLRDYRLSFQEEEGIT